MKTNPHVAIHSWKAISLRIVWRPSKIKFVKGPVSKLHLKCTVFTAHLLLKVLSFSQMESSMFTSETFKAQSTHPDMSTWQVYRTFYFESSMHCKIYASFRWEPATFQVDCMPNPKLGIYRMVYSRIPLSFYETVPLKNYSYSKGLLLMTLFLKFRA